MNFSVRASVRRVGAIGIFYVEVFRVENVRFLGKFAKRGEILDAFFAQFGEKWELNHIVSYAEEVSTLQTV